jgi:hypothetical protein
MSVHFNQGHFEILVIQNQKLLFFNSFEYLTPETLSTMFCLLLNN